jgi:hypothetical protein
MGQETYSVLRAMGISNKRFSELVQVGAIAPVENKTP